MDRNDDVTDPEPSPATDEQPGANREAVREPWRQSTDGPPIQTDTQGMNICSRCNRPIPLGAKRCSCGVWAPTKLRKDDTSPLVQKLLDDYKPQTTFLVETCEQLARSLVESRTLPAGSPEWQRVWNTAQDLTKILDASRVQIVAATDADLDTLTDDQLIERTTAILRSLLESRDEQRKGEALIAAAAAKHAGLPVQTAAGPAGEAVASTVAPAPACEYCHQTLTRCAEIKATRIEAWEALHYLDPAEVKKRDEHATAVMKKQLGKPLPEWYRE
jgi:hypothetical protein